MPGKRTPWRFRLEELAGNPPVGIRGGIIPECTCNRSGKCAYPGFETTVETPTATKVASSQCTDTNRIIAGGADARQVWRENQYRTRTSIKKLTEQTMPLSQIKYNDNSLSQRNIIQTPDFMVAGYTRPVFCGRLVLYEGDQLKDIYTTPFSIRSIEIIPNKETLLNGEKTVFKGVCNHHDLGPLGLPSMMPLSVVRSGS